MKIERIIHQQMMQLRWHFLACLGLMMALPIEEAFLSLKDGDGFYATGVSLGVPVMAGPLLAGLIACANVQADLDDKRYIFWRSKPVGVKSFMTIKYLVGLFVAFIVIVSPIVFGFLSCRIVQNEKIESGFYQVAGILLFISLLTYSLCFFCNVLVRKTARAWLIGMAMTVFVLLVPFILPLNLKETRDVVTTTFVIYLIFLTIMLVPSLTAFIASLIAVSRNWHLQTNLKGLLWTGAALIFLLMLLFTRQVANIKVLDEKEVFNPYHGCIKRIDGKLLLETQPMQPLEWDLKKQKFENVYVEIENNHIQFGTIEDPVLRYRGYIFAPNPSEEHATGRAIFKANEGNLYVVSMYVSNRRVKPSRSQMVHENVYLRSYNLSSPKLELVSEIDLSGFVDNPRCWPDVVIREVGNKIIAIVNRGCVVAELTQNGQLKVIEKKQGKIGVGGNLNRDRQFSIPMVPLETIKPEERIKFSLDLATVESPYYLKNLNTRVDKYDGEYYFVAVSESGIERYKVVNWNNKFILCEIKDRRSFTILEGITGDTWKYRSRYFVREGKLYTYDDKSLMIFDIRSERIRKLGHYVRSKEIQDIEVLNDGNILLLLHSHYKHFPEQKDSVSIGQLHLLKNPE